MLKIFIVQDDVPDGVLRHFAVTFRIVAPPAIQRAAFKENSCTDPWTVMHRKPADVEDQTFIHNKI